MVVDLGLAPVGGCTAPSMPAAPKPIDSAAEQLNAIADRMGKSLEKIDQALARLNGFGVDSDEAVPQAIDGSQLGALLGAVHRLTSIGRSLEERAQAIEALV